MFRIPYYFIAVCPCSICGVCVCARHRIPYPKDPHVDHDFLCQCHKNIYEHKNSAKKSSSTATATAAFNLMNRHKSEVRKTVVFISESWKWKVRRTQRAKQNCGISHCFYLQQQSNIKCYLNFSSISLFGPTFSLWMCLKSLHLDMIKNMMEIMLQKMPRSHSIQIKEPPIYRPFYDLAQWCWWCSSLLHIADVMCNHNILDIICANFIQRLVFPLPTGVWMCVSQIIM